MHRSTATRALLRSTRRRGGACVGHHHHCSSSNDSGGRLSCSVTAAQHQQQRRHFSRTATPLYAPTATSGGATTSTKPPIFDEEDAMSMMFADLAEDTNASSQTQPAVTGASPSSAVASSAITGDDSDGLIDMMMMGGDEETSSLSAIVSSNPAAAPKPFLIVDPLDNLPSFLSRQFDRSDATNKTLLASLTAQQEKLKAEAERSYSGTVPPNAATGVLSPQSPASVAWRCDACGLGKWRARVRDRMDSGRVMEKILSNEQLLVSKAGSSNSPLLAPSAFANISPDEWSTFTTLGKHHCPVCVGKVRESVLPSLNPTTSTTSASDATVGGASDKGGKKDEGKDQKRRQQQGTASSNATAIAAAEALLINSHPLVAAQWAFDLNRMAARKKGGGGGAGQQHNDATGSNTKPNDVAAGTPVDTALSHLNAEAKTRFWWSCPKCTRHWQETPFNRTVTRGGNLSCPRCHSRDALLEEALGTYSGKRSAHHTNGKSIGSNNSSSSSLSAGWLGRRLESIPYLVSELDPNTTATPVMDIDPALATSVMEEMLMDMGEESGDGSGEGALVKTSGDGATAAEKAISPAEKRWKESAEAVAMWATISVDSQQAAPWRCSYCNISYQMSIRERALMGKDCPSCTGTYRYYAHRMGMGANHAPPNPALLVVKQRPDVAAEIVGISHYHVERLSVMDNTVFGFVCRICLSAYRMRLRDRCLPHGCCPTCKSDPRSKDHSLPPKAYAEKVHHVVSMQKTALKDSRLFN